MFLLHRDVCANENSPQQPRHFGHDFQTHHHLRCLLERSTKNCPVKVPFIVVLFQKNFWVGRGGAEFLGWKGRGWPKTVKKIPAGSLGKPCTWEDPNL